MFFEEVFKALNKARVKYVVAGGIAVVLHGYARFTNDLDLIVHLEEKNLEKFFEALKSAGYLPKVPVTKDQFKDSKQRKKWEKEKGMIVFSFVENAPPHKIIDMFIHEPIRFDLLYKNREDIKIEGAIIPIISIDHLKKIKQKAGRDVDKNDIVQLDAIKKHRRKFSL